MADPTETTKTDAGAAGADAGADAGAKAGADTKTETKSSSALGEGADTKVDEKKGAAGEGDKKADDKKVETKTEDKKPGPVELKLPDGLELDAKLVDGFKATATELGLDSAKAQKVFDQFVGFQQAQSKAADEAFSKQDAAWAAQLKADPELGGAKWDATRADIGRAAKHFKAGLALKLLEAAGLGNQPELVRFVAAVGRALREDSIAGSNSAGGAGERKPFEDVAYPTMDSNEKE